MKHVIIGQSFAGVFAAESIRRHDPRGEIILVGDEPERAYSRALIHEYLAGLVDEPKMHLRDHSFADRLDLTVLAGNSAEALRSESHEIIVGGETVPYDKLLIATGGAPFIPPGIEGLDTYADSVTCFTRLADAKRLAESASHANNVVVLGAGLIGMQAAEAFAHLKKNVTVVELADHVLPLATDELAAEMIRTEMEDRHMAFRTGDSVVKLIGEDETLTAVQLRSGDTVPADALVIAVGVRPNVAWLDGSGLTIDRGILVDDHLRTNLTDVYAAGDCAQGLEVLTGRHMVLATIPIASEQGMVAGCNMAGTDVTYGGGIPLNALQFGRLQMISYGYVKEATGQDVISLLDETKRVYKKFVLDDDRIVGALFVRAIDRAGLFRYLIEQKIDVSAFRDRLIADDFSVAALPADARERMFCQKQTRVAIPEAVGA